MTQRRSVTTETVTGASSSLLRLCQGCGQPLNGKRRQAKSHGPACRQKAYRQRKKLARLADFQRPQASEIA